MMNFDILRKIPVIVFDLDGTVTDFEKIDNEIIRNQIFKNHKVVLFLDKMAWKVNEQDIIKNTTIMLKLRLFVYSLISFLNFKEVLEEYEKLYIHYTAVDILKHIQYFNKLKQKGYHVIIISNNKIVDKLLIKLVEIYSVESKMKALKDLQKTCSIRLVVGNNFMDDIIPAYMLGIKYKYVGKKLKFIKNRAESIEKIKIKKIF